jgi:hypothetical protein
MSRTVLGYFAPTEHRRLNESIGLLLAVVAILMALSLVSFSIDDPSFNIARKFGRSCKTPQLRGYRRSLRRQTASSRFWATRVT